MRILILSDNPSFVSKIRLYILGFGKNDSVHDCNLNNKLFISSFGKPSLVIFDTDSLAVADPAGYLLKLYPKHSVPVVVCTNKHNIRYIMVNAGAIDVINKSDYLTPGGQFYKRFRTSIENVRQSVKIQKNMQIISSKIIAIGGSTGSTQALPEIIKHFNSETPPVICVLHMPPGGYTNIYAEGLNRDFPVEVVEAKQGMYLHCGQVVIAQGSKHLRLFKDRQGYFITSEVGVKVSGHCPSVDVLFDSVAYAAKTDAIGVILTGMGSDGAAGMLNMHNLGAYNIGQDEKTSSVYGMPKVAYENGSVDIQLPLDKIGEEINRKVRL